MQLKQAVHAPRDALEGKGPQRRPQKRLRGRLEEVAKAVGGGYCRLQMPLKLALAVRQTVTGHRLQGGEGSPPFQCIPACPFVWLALQPPMVVGRYRANRRDLQNPNFCAGCFELIISKIFATASKMGKKNLFLRFFLQDPFLRRALHQKKIAFFFAFWGLGLIHFATAVAARDRAYLGLWDGSPFLHRHTNVDQLDSEIAVHSTDKHQQA